MCRAKSETPNQRAGDKKNDPASRMGKENQCRDTYRKADCRGARRQPASAPESDTENPESHDAAGHQKGGRVVCVRKKTEGWFGIERIVPARFFRIDGESRVS